MYLAAQLDIRQTRDRTGWMCIATGALAIAVAEITLLLGYAGEGPSESLAWEPWLAFSIGYIGLIAGLVLLAGIPRGPGGAKRVLDAALLSSGLGTAVWYFRLRPMVEGRELDFGALMLDLEFLTGDLLLLVAACYLAMVAVRARSLNPASTMLAGGAFMFTHGTILGAPMAAAAEGAVQLLHVAEVIGFSLIATSALARADTTDRPLIESNGSQGAEFSEHVRWLEPYLPIAAALGAFGTVMAYELVEVRTLTMASFAPGALMLGLAGLRQMAALVEKQREIRLLNASLEATVLRRTQQLERRHRLAKGISSSLDATRVMREAVRHVYELLDAREATLRLSPRAAEDLSREDDPEFIENGLSLDFEELNETATASVVWADREFGTLSVSRRDKPFDATDQEVLRSVALEVGAALSNAVLFRRAVLSATRDNLTGLANHAAAMRRIFEDMESHQYPAYAVLMIDIVNFKLFNDCYGHEAGDRMLIEVGRLLRSFVRDDTHVGRVGADEFILALPGLTTEEALVRGGAIREKLLEGEFDFTGSSDRVPLEISIGVAGTDERLLDPYELLAEANLSLGMAMRSRDRVCSARLSELSREADDESFGLLEMFVTAIDNKDAYTKHHSDDVAHFALMIARELGYSEDEMATVRRAALLHDIGKICVPNHVLNKPGKLTDREFEIIKQHPAVGAMIVQSIPGLGELVDGVLYHHERFDGFGYPEGLAGAEIPEMGRLIAVADAFSAMTTDRPYRRGMDYDVALEQVELGKGTQFDPVMAEAFLRAMRREHRRAA